MFRFAVAMFHYFGAAVLIWAALQMAPDMTWPRTDVETMAALMLVAGMGSKLMGHAWLLSLSRARVR